MVTTRHPLDSTPEGHRRSVGAQFGHHGLALGHRASRLRGSGTLVKDCGQNAGERSYLFKGSTCPPTVADIAFLSKIAASACRHCEATIERRPRKGALFLTGIRAKHRSRHNLVRLAVAALPDIAIESSLLDPSNPSLAPAGVSMTAWIAAISDLPMLSTGMMQGRTSSAVVRIS